MSGGGAFTRRALLRLLGWLGLAGLARWLAPGRASRAATVGAGILRHGESAEAVGAEFVRRFPHEADLPTLLRLLELPQPDLSRLPEARRQALPARLGTRHREDFRRGRVEKLHGWTLSLTELRLCGLVHLSQGRARALDLSAGQRPPVGIG